MGNSIYYGIDKIVYLLVLGGFYAVLSKTDGYRKLISNIASSMKVEAFVIIIVYGIDIAFLIEFETKSAVYFALPVTLA